MVLVWLVAWLASWLPVDDPVANFLARVEAYAAMRHQVALHATPRLGAESDPETIQRACNALSAELVRARPHARVGELFEPAISSLLRERIREVATPEALRAWYHALYSEGQRPPRRRVSVHAHVPVDDFSPVVPVALLHVLPELPAALAYRLAGRDLLIVDPDASLVIDVLPEALPRAPHP